MYVFGNEDLKCDNSALEVASTIRDDGIEFITVKPNESLPFDNGQDVVIMDVVEGLTGVKLIKGEQSGKIVLSPRTTTHDFDLGFQLRYLKKLGKLGKITIIGLPMMGKIDYNRIHSIFKKLVAQDIHGS